MSDEESKRKAQNEMDKRLGDYRRDFYADVSDEVDYGRSDRQHTA